MYLNFLLFKFVYAILILFCLGCCCFSLHPPPLNIVFTVRADNHSEFMNWAYLFSWKIQIFRYHRRECRPIVEGDGDGVDCWHTKGKHNTNRDQIIQTNGKHWQWYTHTPSTVVINGKAVNIVENNIGLFSSLLDDSKMILVYLWIVPPRELIFFREGGMEGKVQTHKRPVFLFFSSSISSGERGFNSAIRMLPFRAFMRGVLLAVFRYCRLWTRHLRALRFQLRHVSGYEGPLRLLRETPPPLRGQVPRHVSSEDLRDWRIHVSKQKHSYTIDFI